MSLRRKILYSLTAATILLLLSLPATGWLARQQLLLVSPERENASVTVWQSVAAQHPEDFALQFALALRAKTSKEKFANLESLRKRFPQEGAIPAALLAVMCDDAPPFQRVEEDILLPPLPKGSVPTSPTSGPAGPPPGFGGPGTLASSSEYAPEKRITPEILAKFEAIAAEGESLEPDNTFFPALCSAWYFQVHRDDDALAAWKRAASKSDWNDHTIDTRTARIKLLRAVNSGNEVGFLPRATRWVFEEYPQHTPVRFAARVISAKAVAAEHSGDAETGMTLRRCTRRIAETIQDRNDTKFGNYISSHLLAIAMVRPGGAPPIKRPYSPKFENRDAAITYLKRIGHPKEADAIDAAIHTARTAQKIYQDGVDKTYISWTDKTVQLQNWWVRSALCITGVIFSLVFAGIFALVFRFSPRLQRGEPLQASARWGVSVGILVPLCVAVVAVVAPQLSPLGEVSSEDRLNLTILFAIVGPMLLIVPPIWCRLSWRQLSHGIFVMLTTLLTVAGICGILQWGVLPFYAPALRMVVFCYSGEQSTPDLWKSIHSFASDFSSYGNAVIIPLALLGTFAIFSRILRIPIAAGVTRGMRAMAVPLACVFLFGYVACFFATLRHENAAIAEMERMVSVGERQVYQENLREH